MGEYGKDRTVDVHFRLSEKEAEFLRGKADKKHLSVSGYVRTTLLKGMEAKKNDRTRVQEC